MSKIPYSITSVSRSKLTNLTNVNVINVEESQILTYDSATNKWVNANNTGGGPSTTLAGLNDVQIIESTAENQILTYFPGTKWTNHALGLDDLTDTNTFSAYDGQILTYNGSAWVPGTAFSNGRIKMGILAGSADVSNSIAIGVLGGNTDQATEAIAIGNSAGALRQKTQAISLGNGAGQNDQQEGSIAIGGNATARTNQKKYSVAIGGIAGTSNQGEYSLSVGSKTNALGNYSIAVGNDCDTTANNSIVFNAGSTEFNKSNPGMYIATKTIQEASGANAVFNDALYYNNSTGEIKSRRFQAFNVYSGIFPLSSNTTGISIVRDISKNGRYIIDYSVYGDQLQITFPTIQIVPYIYDDTIVNETLIREISASYFHDSINQTITVHMGAGTTFRNEFQFSFSFTDLGQLLFYGIAGGLGDANGNDVIKEITSINFSGDQFVPEPPLVLTENYSETFEWEHITTIKPGEKLNNPYTGQVEPGAPPVLKTIESMTGTGKNGIDIELHIIVLDEFGNQYHMHYKNAPLNEIFDYTRDGVTSSPGIIFSRFGNSNTWNSGSRLGDDVPFEAQANSWSFVHTNNIATRGFSLTPASVVMGSDIVTASDGSPFAWGPGNTTKWVSVSVYARRCINQDDCVLSGDLNSTAYLASVQSGYPINTVFYQNGYLTNLPPEVENSLPCWGKHTAANITDNQSLILTRKTLIFLFTFLGGWTTPFNGGSFGDESQWTRINDTPQNYITQNFRKFTIYKKVVPAGNYTIDTNIAFYLFADAHGLEPT